GSHGVIGFVSNGGWRDSNTADGVRLTLSDELSDIYVFNLRGNSRNAGESAKKDGGNVFGVRVGITIIIAVRREIPDDVCIHYFEATDYATADEKLQLVRRSTLDSLDWRIIEPNIYGDWLNQRSDDCDQWPTVGDRKSNTESKFFKSHSLGLSTNRD